jgi:hypothetical protein
VFIDLRLPLESISEQEEFSQRAVPRERERKKKLFASMKSYFKTEKRRRTKVL